MAFPKIISPDDHVVEPPGLWVDRLATKHHGACPAVKRERVVLEGHASGQLAWSTTDDGAWCDVWHYEDRRMPSIRLHAAVGFDEDDRENVPITFDEMRPGCYESKARLADMDIAGIEGSMCFPNFFVRFCGQTFLHATDHDLAKLCVEAYNDWIIEDWCGPSEGRLIPMCIVPLWDPALAVREVERNAARGARAVAFSELPANLGLPSIHTGEWDQLFATCEATGTVVAMHVGSGSKMVTSSSDAPEAVIPSLQQQNGAVAFVDWLFSGKFEQFPDLKAYIAESQIGWLPYMLERVGKVWDKKRAFNGVRDGLVPEPPVHYFKRNMYFSFFDDEHGVASLDELGCENVLYETDYPHPDSVWPDAGAFAEQQLKRLDDGVIERVVRGNAIDLLRLAPAFQ